MALTEKDRDLKLANSLTDSQHVEEEREIDLIELLYRLLENVKYIVIAAVFCALIAGIYSFFFTAPKYQATAKLYVMNSKDSALNLSDLQIGSYLTLDYQEVFKTWEVHEMVIQELGLPYTYQTLEKMLSVSNPPNTRILNITASSKDPGEATDIANAYAKVAKKYISATMAADEPNVLSVALLPTRPVSPNKTMNVLLGLILGAFLAMAVITIQFVLDDKIKTADDILRYADLPNLAVVPVVNSGEGGAKPKAQRPPKERKKPEKG